MKLDRLNRLIEDNLPVDTAMDGDRIGIQISTENQSIKTILVTLELNQEVVIEAIDQSVDCIVTFHPLIYSPVFSIDFQSRVGKLLSLLIKNSISLISVHTNYDAFSEGTSKILSDRLGFSVTGFMEADKKHNGFGMGVISEPEKPMSQEFLLEKICKICRSPLRYCNGGSDLIHKIAILGGSGSSFIDLALKSNVDAFITADVTYHKFHQVDGKLMLIDPGHFEMEQFVPFAMSGLLKEILKNEDIENVLVSKSYTNPVRYYPDKDLYMNKQLNNINTNY